MTRTTSDGFAIFKAIAVNRDVFSAVESAINQAAQKILVAAVKNSALDLNRLLALRRAVGAEEFGLLLDDLSAGDLRKIIKKADRHLPGIANKIEDELRTHIERLATGSVDVSAEPERPTRRPRSRATPQTPNADAPEWPTAIRARPARRVGGR
jgi:hypothetical protein